MKKYAFLIIIILLFSFCAPSNQPHKTVDDLARSLIKSLESKNYNKYKRNYVTQDDYDDFVMKVVRFGEKRFGRKATNQEISQLKAMVAFNIEEINVNIEESYNKLVSKDWGKLKFKRVEIEKQDNGTGDIVLAETEIQIIVLTEDNVEHNIIGAICLNFGSGWLLSKVW